VTAALNACAKAKPRQGSSAAARFIDFDRADDQALLRRREYAPATIPNIPQTASQAGPDNAAARHS
jgi:hypothetical protein